MKTSRDYLYQADEALSKAASLWDQERPDEAEFWRSVAETYGRMALSAPEPGRPGPDGRDPVVLDENTYRVLHALAVEAVSTYHTHQALLGAVDPGGPVTKPVQKREMARGANSILRIIEHDGEWTVIIKTIDDGGTVK